MGGPESLLSTKWECKYHVVFIPKCWPTTLYQERRRHLGEVFRRLAEQKESPIEEAHLRPDHVHMVIAIPSKYAVSQVIGYIKGRSAIHLARVYGEAPGGAPQVVTLIFWWARTKGRTSGTAWVTTYRKRSLTACCNCLSTSSHLRDHRILGIGSEAASAK